MEPSSPRQYAGGWEVFPGSGDDLDIKDGEIRCDADEQIGVK